MNKFLLIGLTAGLCFIDSAFAASMDMYCPAQITCYGTSTNTCIVDSQFFTMSPLAGTTIPAGVHTLKGAQIDYSMVQYCVYDKIGNAVLNAHSNFQMTADTSHGSWQQLGSNYFTCTSSNPNQCPFIANENKAK